MLKVTEQYKDFSYVTRASLQHALSEHGLTLSEPETEELMKAYDDLSTFPEVNSALSALEQPNITCVVFSNGTKSMVSNSVHKSSDLKPYSGVFSDIVTVDEVRAFKPAPEVYAHLAHKTGMEGREGDMWLISGNPFDVVGARAAGMKAAWVDRAGGGWQDALGGEEGKPTVVVKGLDEVVDVVMNHTNS